MGTKSIGNGPKMVFLSAEIYKSVVPNPFVTAGPVNASQFYRGPGALQDICYISTAEMKLPV